MNVIIAGAGKGIGFELVRHFIIERKAKVIALSRHTGALEEWSARHLPDARSLQIIKTDISDDAALEAYRKQIAEMGIRIDALVVTAGLLIKKPFAEMQRSDFETLYATNVYGVFALIRQTLPFFAERAHIVTLGSMGGVEGTLKFPGMFFYSSSKAALACMTECLAEELKEYPIHINCLALGAVETEMKNSAFPAYKAPHTAAEMAAFIAGFTVESRDFFNGKVLPVAVTVP